MRWHDLYVAFFLWFQNLVAGNADQKQLLFRICHQSDIETGLVVG